jgi:hypothetical protein
MSADSDISTLLSHATNAAASLASSANTLVGEAVAALEDEVEFPEPPFHRPRAQGIDYGEGSGDWWDVFRNNPKMDNQNPPTSFPTWPVVELDPIPNTQRFDEVDVDVDDVTFPTLSFPSFNYPDVAGIPTFDKTVPDAGAEQTLPPIPATDSFFEPNFLSMNAIDSVSMAVSAPEFIPIDTTVTFDPTVFDTAFTRFKAAIFGGIGNIPGLDGLLAELREQTRTTLDAVLPATLEVIAARMNAKQSAVLAFQNDIRARLTNRLAEEKARVVSALTDRSGWDLPQAAQVSRQAAIEQFAIAWAADADASADTQTSELALAFFESCGELLASFITALQKLKAEEISLVLEAHRNALAYTKAVIAALLAQYEAETFTTQDIEFQKAEAQLKLFEANLMVAMLTYEVARANLQAEEAKQDNDAAAIQTYQSRVARARNEVRRFAALVGAARGEVRFKQFAIERFELLVKAYEARINAYEAQIAARIANIDGDTAKVDGQLKKVEGFEAEVRGFLQLIETKQAIIEAESTRNEAVIDEFEQRVKAAIAALEKSSLDNAYELKKYEVIADDVLADARLALREAKTEMDFIIGKAEGQQDAYRLTQERNVELMKVELERLRSIASVNEQGAGIMASMAQGAMSAANGIATAVLSEEE